jgi:hypothetical protein
MTPIQFRILSIGSLGFALVALFLVPYRHEIGTHSKILFVSAATLTWGFFGYFVMWKTNGQR